MEFFRLPNKRLQKHVSRGWRAVGVVQHGVEGPGEVVGPGAAGLTLGQGNQTGQEQEEEQEEV